MAMTVDQALIEFQKLQLAGEGKRELLLDYDGMVQEIESFALRDIDVRGTGDDNHKSWISAKPEYRGPDSDYTKIVPAIKIKSGKTYHY